MKKLILLQITLLSSTLLFSSCDEFGNRGLNERTASNVRESRIQPIKEEGAKRKIPCDSQSAMGETVGGNTSNLHTANTSWNLEEQLIGKDPVICREARRIVWDGPLLTTFYEVSAARVRATEMWRNFSKKVGECNKVLRQYKALREEINTARMLYTKLDIAKQKEKQAHDNRNYAQQQRSSLSLASSGQINFSEESKAEELKKYEQEIEELEKYKQAIEAREECRQALKIELEEIRKQALELWYKAEEYEHVANNFEKILKARIGADLTNEIQRVDTEFIQEEAIVDTHSAMQDEVKNIDQDASLPIILSQVLKVRAHATRVWRSLGNAANKYYEVLIEYRRLSAKLNIEKQKEEQREGNNYNLNLLWRVTNETPKSEVARLEDDIQELCRKRKEAHKDVMNLRFVAEIFEKEAESSEELLKKKVEVKFKEASPQA